MATSLHEQLKAHYVSNPDRHEQAVDGYRIDAIDRYGRLIEVQCASLAAIRRKILTLLDDHRVIVCKPLAVRKRITKLDADGEQVSSRVSPKRESFCDLFTDLVYFAGVFPHKNLRLDIVLTEQEEIRVPRARKGRSRHSRRYPYTVQDRCLLDVRERITVTTPGQLWKRINPPKDRNFTTADIAKAGDIPRWQAQKLAWCFRKMGFLQICDKQGNAHVYRKQTRRAA